MTTDELAGRVALWLLEQGPGGVALLLAYLGWRELKRSLSEAHRAVSACTPKLEVEIKGPVPVYLVHPPPQPVEVQPPTDRA